MFAVRQWPGNGADLDFRGVLEGCTAAIVAAAPIEGTMLRAPGKESIANTYVREVCTKARFSRVSVWHSADLSAV